MEPPARTPRTVHPGRRSRTRRPSPGSDYYEIGLVQYTEKLSKDLPATTLRGYVQIETPANAAQSKHIALTYPNGSPILDATGAQVFAVDDPQYLGPTIVAQSDRPVRVKFTNYLPAGSAGNLFLPVDTTLMGAGMGPNGQRNYTQNRATLHLHGGATPWISDGTPYQWTTPGGEATTTTQRGVSVQFVPDMWFDPTTHDVVPGGHGRSATERPRARLADLLLHQPAERAADVLPRPCRRHHAPQRVCRRGRAVPAAGHGRAGLHQRRRTTPAQPDARRRSSRPPRSRW